MKRSREPEEVEEHPSPSGPLGPGSDSASPPATAEVRANKIAELDESPIEGDSESSPGIVMRCSLPPHREVLPFRSYGDYEVHYSKAHVNRCVECGKNLPSEHLLGVHIEECHDAFAAVRREKGEHTYSCFVEGCDRKCRTPQKRRQHLIDKHLYPKNYFFAVTKEGVDGRRSMLLEGGYRRRASSSATNAGAPNGAARRNSLRQTEASEGGAGKSKPAAEQKLTQGLEVKPPTKESVDVAMEDLTGAMSALQFVPPNIRFGRGKGKSGFSKK
ncbi:hypothetical protein DL766_008620 [Monosporascus sp. MC13-8B]|uniref:C2H2-type domain-containing protein n=1 Tax=Monosporascus cannonballus TaxID=155416 RepID=A0ABY0GWT3_9PEZI|nr:hypothetical protein DL762_008422 [Monosporascus cannonballus]RYO82087.1 hypothetical protein DL763_008358 [Monosporascus cannonballus]RYP18687.1 hypothetical protein DL766_008620 [Monosporascus sp. MC13-8B]